jgi:predicted dinucleotide-binding enzyme
MRIGILGSGVVGRALAAGFIQHGYDVMAGSRQPEKLEAWKDDVGDSLLTGKFAETAAFGDIIVLAAKGTAAENVLDLAGEDNLSGKTIIDTTNPIADEEPVNGVIKYFTDLNYSLMEKLQKKMSNSNFVKAFSCVGSHFMVNPNLGGETPTMFICGNDDSAKKQVNEILYQFGWEVEDMGAAEAARAIEPLAILWCIPGFRENRWTHAFRLLKV